MNPTKIKITMKKKKFIKLNNPNKLIFHSIKILYNICYFKRKPTIFINNNKSNNSIRQSNIRIQQTHKISKR